MQSRDFYQIHKYLNLPFSFHRILNWFLMIWINLEQTSYRSDHSLALDFDSKEFRYSVTEYLDWIKGMDLHKNIIKSS
jgi:hypothetical protein